MSFSTRNRMSTGEAALIVAGGALAAWYSPPLDPLAIAFVVLLGRFRGRIPARVGAFAFSVVVLVAAIVGPRLVHSSSEFVRLFALICAMWLCTIFASSAKVDRSARPEPEGAVDDRDKVWEAVLKIFPGWMWVSRADGTPVSVSQGAPEYTGLDPRTVLSDGVDCIHPDQRQPRRDYWKQLLKTEESGAFEMRVRGADGNYRWFAS